MSVRRVDVLVIGAGPAGLAAAGAAAAAGATCVVVDRMGPGGQLMNLGTLHGVPDLAPGTSGPELIATLADQAMACGAEIAIDDVQRVAGGDAGGWLIGALEATWQAATVVVASGLTPGTTGLAEEPRFAGRGLSHCAQCDGPLHAGQPVAVAGGDDWAIEEAIELAAHASHVTLIADGRVTAPAERLAILAGLGNVVIIEGRIAGLGGEDGLQQIEVVAGGRARRIAARGLFVYGGRRPARDFLDAALDAGPGLFQAGDVRPGAEPRIAEAIADGRRTGQNAACWAKARSSP